MIGSPTGENKVILSTKAVTDAGATQPYIVLQEWGRGEDTATVYHKTTGASTTTYANAAIDFAANSTTGEWVATIPSTQPNAMYWGIIRDRGAGTAAKTDTDIARVVLDWSKTSGLRWIEGEVVKSY